MQGIQTTSDGYLIGGLSVSRALGDFTRSTWTQYPGLLSEPEVTIFSVDADTEFIFESMTNLDAVQSIRRQLRRNLGFCRARVEFC